MACWNTPCRAGPANDHITTTNPAVIRVISTHPGTSPSSPGWFSNVFMACPFLTCCPNRKQGRHHQGEVIPSPPRRRAPSTRRVIYAAGQEKLKNHATTCSPKKLRGCSEGAGPRVGKALAPCKRGLALATLLDCPHYAHDNANKNHSVDQ